MLLRKEKFTTKISLGFKWEFRYSDWKESSYKENKTLQSKFEVEKIKLRKIENETIL